MKQRRAVKKDYTKAVGDLQGIADPGSNCLAILASSYCMAGQIDKAKSSVKNIRESESTYTIDLFRRGNNIPDKEALDRLTDGMRQAGLPEI